MNSRYMITKWLFRIFSSLFLFAPFILLADLFLLAWSEIVLDIESLANFLRCLSLDHVGNSLTGHIQLTLDVHVVCSNDQFKKCSLISFEKLSIPGRNIVSSLFFIFII